MDKSNSKLFVKKSTVATFWALVGVFLVILGQFFIPAFRDSLRGSKLFLIPMVFFSLLGITLLVLTSKEKATGKLKKFLMLTGASATGFFVFVFLHNAFYALSTITNHIIVLNYLIEALHAAFFIIAICVCPIGFLVGIVGTILAQVKNEEQNYGM